jgi:hypothetical protein
MAPFRATLALHDHTKKRPGAKRAAGWLKGHLRGARMRKTDGAPRGAQGKGRDIMHSEAPRPARYEVPGRPDLDGEMASVLEELRAALCRLEADPADLDAARHLIDASHQVYDLRAQMADYCATADLAGLVYRAAFAEGVAEGRRDERAEWEGRQQVPRQRKGGGAHGKQSWLVRVYDGDDDGTPSNSP